MEWSDFVESVQKWAEEKGIYENSKEEDQAIGAINELGEVAFASTDEEIEKEIGDVLVYLVNACKLAGKNLDKPLHSNCAFKPNLSSVFHWISNRDYQYAVDVLAACYHYGFVGKGDIMDCCEAAWYKISKRKGKMVNGRFVKEEDL